jgi:zinc transport system substrate-binding protein
MQRFGMALSVVAVFLGAAAAGARAESAASGKLRAVVSILPQGYFVERIGGARVDVEVLVKPGQSPHTYEPTPAQIGKVARAQIYFAIGGMPFETRLLEKLTATNKQMLVVDTRKGVPLRTMTADEAAFEQAEEHHEAQGEHHEEPAGRAEAGPAGEPDPHFWLSPRLAKILAANVCDGLKALDPAHAAEYDANLKKVQDDLDAVDAKLAAALAPFKGRAFFVYHPAFGYFADVYGLKQLPVEIEGKSPTAKELAALIQRAKKENVKVIFVQPQFSPKSARAVATAIGGVVVPMDDLARDYVHNLEDMAGKIAEALGGDKAAAGRAGRDARR